MQLIFNQVSACCCKHDARGRLIIAISVVSSYLLGEILIPHLSEASAEQWQSLLCVPLLAAAYLLGMKSASGGRTSVRKSKLGAGKDVLQTEGLAFAGEHQAAKQTAQRYPLRQNRAASLDGAFRSSTGMGSPVEKEDVNKRIDWLKNTAHVESDTLLLERAQQDGLEHDASSYLTVMSACNRTGNVDVALMLMNQLMDKGVDYDYSAMSLNVRTRFFKLVSENADEKYLRENGLKLLETIQAHGMMPPNLVQNRVICAWRSKLPKHMLEFFAKMREDGVALSSTAYRCIMAAHERAEPHRTLELYDEMANRGLKLDRVSFNATLCAYSHLQMTQEALQLFEQMPHHGLAPNGKTYGALIRVCAATSKPKEAVDLFESMRGEGLEPNRFAYNDAIHCCVKIRKLGKAMQLYKDMVQSNVPPCNATYHLLAKSCEKRGWVELSRQITEDFERAQKGEALRTASEASTEYRDGDLESE